MEKEDRIKISNDYKKVNDSICKILSGEEQNSFVKDCDYINPSRFLWKKLPLGDSSGEFMYYKGIRDALEEILINGKASLKNFRCPGAPPYIKKYLN